MNCAELNRSDFIPRSVFRCRAQSDVGRLSVRASLAALPVRDKVEPAGDGPVPGKSAGFTVVSYAKRNPLIGLARGKLSKVLIG
jgi:hypothetical protein